jgi:hypothetical protein
MFPPGIVAQAFVGIVQKPGRTLQASLVLFRAASVDTNDILNRDFEIWEKRE